jgi:uncharacterized repeat protein (TIGR03803 family)
MVAAAAWAGTGGGDAPPFSIVHTFTGADGSRPFANLLLKNGTLYGATNGGGAHNAGTVFQILTAGYAQTVLHSFAGGASDGANPLSGLLMDSIGNLYGTTFGGGARNAGTVFKINFQGGYQLLHSFAGPPSEGANPAGTLVADYAGNIYGTTYTGGRLQGWGTTFQWTPSSLYFTGQSFLTTTGAPRAGLVLAGGHLYGTTSGSGYPVYGGTIFEAGVKTPIYTFTGGADGAQPMAALIADSSGNLYGTAMAGGSASFGMGHGVVFEILTSGAEKVLHSFKGTDGAAPTGSLVMDATGNLYGTTMWGGTYNNGTLFRLDPSGNLIVLYNFTGNADGGNPYAGLILDSSNVLWGVASAGGSAASPGGNGVVFKFDLKTAYGLNQH